MSSFYLFLITVATIVLITAVKDIIKIVTMTSIAVKRRAKFRTFAIDSMAIKLGTIRARLVTFRITKSATIIAIIVVRV